MNARAITRLGGGLMGVGSVFSLISEYTNFSQSLSWITSTENKWPVLSAIALIIGLFNSVGGLVLSASLFRQIPFASNSKVILGYFLGGPVLYALLPWIFTPLYQGLDGLRQIFGNLGESLIQIYLGIPAFDTISTLGTWGDDGLLVGALLVVIGRVVLPSRAAKETPAS